MTVANETLVAAFRGKASEAMTLANVPAAIVAAQELQTMVIDSDEKSAYATDCAKVCAETKKNLKSQLATITKPLDDARDAATALAKPQMDQLDAAVNVFKSKQGAWNDEKRRKAEAAQREAERIEREAAAARKREADRIAAENAAAAEAARVAGLPEPVAVVQDIIPEVETFSPTPVVTQTKGTIGGSHETRQLVVEVGNIVTLAQNHPALLTMSIGAAKAIVRDRIKEVGEEAALAELRKEGLVARYEMGVTLK